MNKETAVYQGILLSADQTMNLVLSSTTIIEKSGDGVSAEEKGIIYLRGDDVSWVSPSNQAAYHLVPTYNPLQPNEISG